MAVDIHPASHVERHPGCVEAEVSGAIVLMNIDTGTYCGLDETGAAVWRVIGEGMTVEKLVDELTRAYDANVGQILQDTLLFFVDMREQGLIQVRP